MDPDRLPPERDPETASICRDAVGQAAHTVRYRRSLRRYLGILDVLTRQELTVICVACRIALEDAVSEDDLRATIRAYLDARTEEDDRYVLEVRTKLKELDTEFLATTPPSRTVPDCPTSPSCVPAVPARLPSQSYKATLLSLVGQLDTCQRSLLEVINFLKNVQQSSETRLDETLSQLTAVHSNLSGMCAGLQTTGPLLDARIVSGPPVRFASCDPATRPADAPPSYAAVTRRSAPGPPTRSRLRMQSVATRRKIAEAEAAIRDDTRSFQCTPATKPAKAPGRNQLARGFATAVQFKGNVSELVEAVRLDRSGRFYIQVYGKHLATLRAKLSFPEAEPFQRPPSISLDIPELGTFRVNAPYRSATAGKIAMLVADVPVHENPHTFVVSMWVANQHRWGLSGAHWTDHLSHPRRLNRRTASTNSEDLQWLPSRSIQVFVSKELHSAIQASPFCVCDFTYHPIRRYEYTRSSQRLSGAL